MPQNYFGGRQGELSLGATSSAALISFGKLTNFRCFATRNQIPVTNFDSSGWEENIPGIGSWGLTAESLMMSTAASVEHDTLRANLSAETRSWYKIANTSTTATEGYHWQGYGHLEDWDLSGGVDDPQVQNFSIKGDGPYVESST